MKTILQFTLPEEKAEFEAASKGADLAMIIWDLDQWLRSETKYCDLTEECDDAYNKVREKLRDLMSDEGLTFDSEIWT